MMRVQLNHIATALWSSYLIGSKNSLYINPRALKLSVKSRICVPGTNFWMVRWIDYDGARNYSTLSMKHPYGSSGIYQYHEMNLSLYPPMTFFLSMNKV